MELRAENVADVTTLHRNIKDKAKLEKFRQTFCDYDPILHLLLEGLGSAAADTEREKELSVYESGLDWKVIRYKDEDHECHSIT